MGRIPPGVGAIDCPQAAVTQGGVVCLSRMAAAVWVMTQDWDPVSYSLSSLPKASIPSLTSGISSPLCPLPFAGAQGKWLQMKIYALAL